MVQMRNMRLLKDKTRKAMASGLGPASYNNAARPTLTFNDLRNIDNVGDVKIQCSSAVYIAKPMSISNNVLTYLVMRGNNGASTETANATVLNAITFNAVAVGQ